MRPAFLFPGFFAGKKIPLHQEGGEGAILKGLGEVLAVATPVLDQRQGKKLYSGKEQCFLKNDFSFFDGPIIQKFVKISRKVYAVLCKVFLSFLCIIFLAVFLCSD